MMEQSERAALASAVERLGDRWTLLIVHALLDGPARFGDLQRLVDGISPNILSHRLKQLEADGVVLAVAYQERPARFRYELTARGRELAGVLTLLAQWGADADGGEAMRHEACGTPAEPRWWCPTCERVVEGETSDLHHL